MCGGRALLLAGAALIALACGVVAILLQAQILYDVRAADLRNASTGEGFLVNEGTCIGYVTSAKIEGAYPNKECTAGTTTEEDLGRLVAANVHALYDYHTSDTSNSQVARALNAAVDAALGTDSDFVLAYATAVVALTTVGTDNADAPRTWKTKCSDVYSGLTAATALDETPKTSANLHCVPSSTYSAAVALSNSQKSQLLLHCEQQFALGAYAGYSAPFFLTPSGTQGTFGLPVHDDASFVTPFYTPPPFNMPNTSATREIRAKALYGHRFGWTLFGAIPVLMLAVYISVDGVFAFLCYVTVQESVKQVTASETAVRRVTPWAPWSKISVAGATMTASRRMRLVVVLVGLIISIVLTAVYDWAPWNWGAMLPRPICDPNSSGEGWQFDTSTTWMQVIIFALLAAGVLVVQLAQLVAGCCGAVAPPNTSQLRNTALASPIGGIVSAGIGQSLLFFGLQVLAVIAFLIFETTQSITWGNAWQDAIRAENSTQAAVYSDLIIESTTRNVAIAIAGGVALSSIFARWMFTLRGTVTHVFCAFLWLVVTACAALPLFFTYGATFEIDPTNELLVTPAHCSLQTTDSFENVLCKATNVALTYFLIITASIIILTWVPWILLGCCSALEAPKGAEVSQAVTDAALNDEYQRLPLLSFRPTKDA